MAVTRIDSWTVIEPGGTYDIPAAITGDRIVIAFLCAEGDSTTNVTSQNSTLGGYGGLEVKNTVGWVAGTVYLSVYCVRWLEGTFDTMSGNVLVSNYVGTPDNSFVIVATLDGVDQMTPVDLSTAARTDSGSAPTWTLATNSDGGFGVTGAIGAVDAAWAFSTADGWTERVDQSNDALSRAYCADKALTGVSTTATISGGKAHARVSVAFRPSGLLPPFLGQGVF